MSSSLENTEVWDEDETTLQELFGEERSPVEESFYESYIIQSRTAVDNLYASNVLSCQKHMKEMGDLARQRKVKLSTLDREQKKLLKRMEKLKQETQLQNRSKTMSNDLRVETADNFNRTTHRRRSSLPPLNTTATDTEVQTSKVVKSSDRLTVPGNILSRSCNDITSLYNKDSPSQDSALVLPAIKPSRSHENLSGSPFITHIPTKVHKYPHTTRGLVSREESRYEKSWNEKNFKTNISTKVKWVPRS